MGKALGQIDMSAAELHGILTRSSRAGKTVICRLKAHLPSKTHEKRGTSCRRS